MRDLHCVTACDEGDHNKMTLNRCSCFPFGNVCWSQPRACDGGDSTVLSCMWHKCPVSPSQLTRARSSCCCHPSRHKRMHCSGCRTNGGVRLCAYTQATARGSVLQALLHLPSRYKTPLPAWQRPLGRVCNYYHSAGGGALTLPSLVAAALPLTLFHV
jgi:hypothetical protein